MRGSCIVFICHVLITNENFESNGYNLNVTIKLKSLKRNLQKAAAYNSKFSSSSRDLADLVQLHIHARTQFYVSESVYKGGGGGSPQSGYLFCVVGDIFSWHVSNQSQGEVRD